MRRRQINAQRAQEVAVTITEQGAFYPVQVTEDGVNFMPAHLATKTPYAEQAARDLANHLAPGQVMCPACRRVMKASGGASAHMRNCKGNV